MIFVMNANYIRQDENQKNNKTNGKSLTLNYGALQR